jgi:hypothetical protein
MKEKPMTTNPQLKNMLRVSMTAWALALGACASDGNAPSAANRPAPQEQVAFVDLQGFDRQLGVSLSAPLPKVEVGVVDVIKPSAIPERLQRWMAAVEEGGGQVKMIDPPPQVQARSVFAVVSAATTIWSASKMVKQMSQEAQFKAAREYDAQIQLKLDASGDKVIDKVVFVKRAK